MTAFHRPLAAAIAAQGVPLSADMARLSPERETGLRELAARAEGDEFFVSDCEGELQVWRETALTHVRRNETGTITMYSFPSSYRSTDEVIRIDLDTWDPGEDATDDKRRQDINDLVNARAAAATLLAELDAVRKERDEFCDRVDTLTAVAKGNKRHVQEMFLELQKAQAEVAQWRATFGADALPDALARLTKAEAERDALQKRLHDAAMTRTWRNEDGKKFVFVEDIAPALLGLEPGTEADR
ncbi:MULTISPECIES: hypothetical protein [Streptomyces]|uniref:Uncharacterized protein n=1 Tax=Streptomyces dengpaensis TaxID=2049881 RepID=A0ABM6SZ45_9ACTN|nr:MULTISPECIES: hypothetical protein [Streptomyces]AVH59914.1 hypothetical protein C4B68_33735 [Streptomyces dengpaensis]PIB09549.1 hypothetical protein B1C81_10410 [Streptomyces sp. HG99]